MPELGKYATEVLSAYGATALLIAGLIWLTFTRSRRVRRALDVAEARKKNG